MGYVLSSWALFPPSALGPVTNRNTFVHGTCGWLKWCVWRLLECVFSAQFNLSSRPTTPLEVDLFNGGQILTTEFRDAVESKKISVTGFSGDDALESADVVISATGFRKNYSIFDDEI